MPIKPLNMHQKAQKQEAETAKRVGGKVTKGSGNGREKGDVRVHDVLRVECKSTEARSFTVTTEMLDKIELAGALAGEIPAFAIRFMNKGRTLREVLVVPAWVIDELAKK